MMQLCAALILFMTVSTAYGLRCYTCTGVNPESCTGTTSCPAIFDRCFTLQVEGYNIVAKGCQSSLACVSPMACCEGDLCNSAIPSAPSVILLLLCSAIFTLFL